MSRRPAAGNDRAAQNAQTLKALVKLEGNKVCADCKRNKHPRWASWNLGIFVCIRCSGIHRGMGTHISRVKSVDLDAWTDEQLQSVIKWGNTRANKYWEAKLAEGHQPSEAKIENFIRTKYESKRWVMDGPMPDPATLTADDDVPLNIVQEKAKMERSAAQTTSTIQQPLAQPKPAPRAPAQNLFDDDFTSDPPVRPSTADIPATRTVQPVASQPSNMLDFSFTTSSPPPAPASRPAAPSIPNDLFADDGFNAFSSAPAAPKPAPAPAKVVSSPPIPLTSDFNSAFNLSSPTLPSKPAQQAPKPAVSQPTSAMFDPWGSGNDANAWGAPEPAPTKPAPPKVELGSVPAHITPNDIGGGWGAPISSSKSVVQPTVAADEDFGGWTSAPTPAATANSKPSGFGATSDPFDNPWG